MGIGLRPVVEIKSSDIVKNKIKKSTTTKKSSKNEIPNPETGDNIIIYIFSTIISLIGLVFSVFYIKTN